MSEGPQLKVFNFLTVFIKQIIDLKLRRAYAQICQFLKASITKIISLELRKAQAQTLQFP